MAARKKGKTNGTLKKDWVDFKAIKEAVTMQMVLDYYKVSGLRYVGGDLRGPCPIHRGGTGSKHLSVNLSKNAFTCFSSACGARGNVLDFVAAMEKCSVRDAALKLRDWFKAGETVDSKRNDGSIPNVVESIKSLIDEIEEHNSQIAAHTSMVLAKTAAVKNLAASLAKEV